MPADPTDQPDPTPAHPSPTDPAPTDLGPTDLWPTELRLSPDKRSLRISFEGSDPVVLPAELLRVESPSAEVQGHNPSEKRLVPGKRAVGILRVEPVGNYAVRLVFDDGHATGLYGWTYLHELGRHAADLMERYETKLAAAGLSRDPPPSRF